MSTIRLFYGRDTADMVRRIRDAAQRAEGSLGCPSTHPHVSRLEVRETVLEDEVIEAIVDLIEKQHNGVDTVNLDDCGAYLNKQAVQMARALGQCKDVRLSEPTFLTKFFLETFIVSATRLRTLRIQDRFLTDQIEALAKGLTINKSLEDLDLSRSRLLENSTSILAGGLEHNTSLLKLTLRSLSLTDDGMEKLLSSLIFHPSLQVLDLSFNHCRKMVAVADFLRSNTQLQVLNIGYQNMWQAAHLEVSSLAAALIENRSLKCLRLARCKLKDNDAIILADALRHNMTLQHLDLRENNFTDIGIEALACAIGDDDSKCGLRKISVAKNQFGTVGIVSLLKAAESNWNLFHVDITRYPHPDSTYVGKIQFYTALNRGGRRLLVESLPSSIWPFVFQRIRNLDWFDDEIDPMLDSRDNDAFEQDSRTGCTIDSRSFDVSYYLLRNGVSGCL
jgi:Ran GTPase-activating protein (RanGAP) involved in mRNA processing and transport